MNNKKVIQKIEELSINALPALETKLVDGWILRFSNGYAKRANSINPLYPSKYEIKEKIEDMQKNYRSKNLKAVYKLTENVFPHDLDVILEQEGYELDGLTSVQLLSLNEVSVSPAANAVNYSYLNDKWFLDFCKLNNIKETDQATLKKILQNIVPEVWYVVTIMTLCECFRG